MIVLKAATVLKDGPHALCWQCKDGCVYVYEYFSASVVVVLSVQRKLQLWFVRPGLWCCGMACRLFSLLLLLLQLLEMSR
jgi:hypothetical protein